MSTSFWIHPSQPLPVLLPNGSAFITEEKLPRDWIEQDDDVQDRQLREVWTRVDGWASHRGIDRITVWGASPSYNEKILAMGFAFATPISVWDRLLPRSIRGREFVMTGDECCDALSRIREIPSIDVEAFASGQQILRVRDSSWDNTVIIAETAPDLYR
jgi:hypothetical protein